MAHGRLIRFTAGALLLGSSVSLAPALGLLASGMFLSVLALAGLALAWPRPSALRALGRRGRGIVALALVAGVSAGCGVAAAVLPEKRQYGTVWTAQPDPLGAVGTLGVWAPGGPADGGVVRVQPGGAVRYGIGDGEIGWRWEAPRNTAVCAMSAGAPAGVGLLVSSRAGQPCTDVAAVDLRTGRTLWRHERQPPFGADPAAGAVAIGRSAAVVAGTGRVQALDPVGGKPLWNEGPGRRCADPRTPEVAADDADGIVITWYCAEHALIEVREAATGALRWRTLLPLDSFDILSAGPVVLHAHRSDADRGQALLVFTPEGKASALPVSGALGRIAHDAGALPLLHGTGVQVRGDLVHVLLDKGPDDGMAAFGLDGVLRWERIFGTGRAEAFTVDDDEVTVLYDGQPGRPSTFAVLDPATGEDRHTGPIQHARSLDPVWIHRHDDITVVATRDDDIPLAAYRSHP